MTQRYQLEGLIARGGMAEVHLARAQGAAGFTKLVALKRILETYADNAMLTTMFMDEARLAAQLSHPNIVQVFDFGRDEQGYFIAMEYVPGPDLAALLRVQRASGERPPEAPMLDVLIQVLRGLDHAHRLAGPDGMSLGVIHRDVTPGNVLLTGDGIAKLSDFGVARATERLSENTRAGKTKGKAAYMSPEQARSRPIDARSDLFSAGLLLWEVLAGQRCYVTSDDAALIRIAALGEVRTLASVGVDVDPQLAAIVDRALKLDAQDRFPSAAAMAEALESYHRAAYPRYTPAALGAVVHRALGQLPPLPHLALKPLAAGTDPAADAHVAPPPEPQLPEQPMAKGGVRRPRASVGASSEQPTSASTDAAQAPERPKLRPDAPVSGGATRSEVNAAGSNPQQSGGWIKSLAVGVGVALAALVGLVVWDHRHDPALRQTETRPVQELPPPVPMQPRPGASESSPSPAPSPARDKGIEVRTPAEAPKPSGGASARGNGYLSVKCDPWCDIWIDGKNSHRRSPAERIPVPAGTHLVRVVNPELKLHKQATLSIHADEDVARYFNLVLGP